jgi:hypothetical protein
MTTFGKGVLFGVARGFHAQSRAPEEDPMVFVQAGAMNIRLRFCLGEGGCDDGQYCGCRVGMMESGIAECLDADLGSLPAYVIGHVNCLRGWPKLFVSSFRFPLTLFRYTHNTRPQSRAAIN